MENELFDVGDVVWLKSGSPAMTILNTRRDTNATACQWFDKNDLKEGRFDKRQLTKEKPKGDSPRAVFKG